MEKVTKSDKLVNKNHKKGQTSVKKTQTCEKSYKKWQICEKKVTKSDKLVKKSHKKWQTSVKKIQTYEKNDTKSDQLLNEKSEVCEKMSQKWTNYC